MMLGILQNNTADKLVSAPAPLRLRWKIKR